MGNSFRRSERAGRSMSRGSVPKVLENEFRWPPVFESSGGEYLFDPRSNMFYEPKSDFFYDCNSKLYYSNKRKAYFRLTDPGSDVFEQVSGDRTEEAAPVKSSSKSKSSEEDKKPSIKIRIRSKSLSRSRARSDSTGRGRSEETLDRRRKEQMKNVEKWNNQLSLQPAMMGYRDVALSVASSAPRTVATSCGGDAIQKLLAMAQGASKKLSSRVLSSSPPDNELSPSEAVVTTNGGQPICVICRRKFASLDLLRRHEQQSELHKSNLSKRKVPEAPPSKNEPDVVQYQDRAKKRRLLHSDVPAVLPGRRVEVPCLKERAFVDPEAALGDQNVGNQLYQRMKAKSNNDSASASTSGAFTDIIKEEWKRIESMARPQTLMANEKVKGLGHH